MDGDALPFHGAAVAEHGLEAVDEGHLRGSRGSVMRTPGELGGADVLLGVVQGEFCFDLGARQKVVSHEWEQCIYVWVGCGVGRETAVGDRGANAVEPAIRKLSARVRPGRVGPAHVRSLCARDTVNGVPLT